MKKINTPIEIHRRIEGNISNNTGSRDHLRIKCTSTNERFQIRECISSRTSRGRLLTNKCTSSPTSNPTSKAPPLTNTCISNRTSKGHLLTNKCIGSRTSKGHLPMNKGLSSRLRRCTTHSTHSKRRSSFRCSTSNNSTHYFTEAIRLCVASPFSLA